MKKPLRQEDGLYHIGGKTYKFLEGTRAQVWHETAYKTAGNLVKSQLLMTKRGHIVSKKKHLTAKKSSFTKRFPVKKGVFGLDRSKMEKSKSRSMKKGGSKLTFSDYTGPSVASTATTVE